MRYRTTTWARIRERNCELPTDFAKHLREVARPRQIAFQRLMTMSSGMPVGIECKSGRHEQWAFILPDMSGDSPWRIQNFDQDGFSGHSCYDTLQQAAETLVNDGYRVPDPGALDRCSTTLRWAIGVKRSEIRLLFNQGKITWAETLDRMKAVADLMQEKGETYEYVENY